MTEQIQDITKARGVDLNDPNFSILASNPQILNNDMFSYIALSLESHRNNSPIPEMMMFMDRGTLLQMLQLFGGSEVRFPTMSEFSDHIVAAVALYHIVCEKKDLEWVCKTYSINGNKARTIGKIVKTWTEHMTAKNLDIIEFMNGAANDVQRYLKRV